MSATSWQQYRENNNGLNMLIALISVALVIFQLYTGLFGALDALQQRAIHLGFGLILLFLTYPRTRSKDGNIRVGLLDIVLVFASIAVIAYPLLNYDWITTERFPLISPLSLLEIVIGITALIVVLEGTRRITGNSLVYVIIGFFIYAFLAPYLPGVLKASPITFSEMLDFQYLGTNGIFGTPLGASATDIALFIIFGAVLLRSGGSNLINNVAAALTGKSRGGSAKVAVLGSSLMGMVSGSGTANVATVGVVTIPMMKKSGYKAEYAAAVEAVSSTGGQIMPPIMGAAAFVMSSITGISYTTIIGYAIFPAILYFLAIFIAVHLQAVRHRIGGLTSTISIKETLRDYGHMVIPILVLIFTLVAGFTPRFSAGISVIVAIITAELRSTTRMGLGGILEALVNGAKGMLMVILTTAAAGMVVGIIDLTSVGIRLGAAFMDISGGHLLTALVLAMFLAILLGMGMPTTPAYIIQASIVIPALINMGLPLYIAHMFAFYYSCLSLITPPVAISSYAASAIAGSDMWRTSWLAFRLGLPAYIIPFMFVYGPSLLLVGSVVEILVTVITAVIGVTFLAIASEGYLTGTLSRWERLVSFAIALLLIAPSMQTAIPGLALGAAFVGVHLYRKKQGKRQLESTVE